jgi:hypothetical protein
MYKAVIGVIPSDNYKLILTFDSGEKRLFNMIPYLNHGIFSELQDVDLFNTVKIDFDTISWDNDADLDPEILYKESVEL